MPDFSLPRLETSHPSSSPSVVAVAVALVVIVIAGIFAEVQNDAVHRQNERAAVTEQLGLVRARLEGNINSNLQLVRGLVAVISTQPSINQKQFSEIASSLIGEHSQLRSVAAAPGLVIRLMHPIEGNEKAIGLDYNKNELQRRAALRAVNSAQMVLAGPVNLVQGGTGFIGRYPVFTDNDLGDKELWGLVSAVVDVQKLYVDSGLYNPKLGIEIAISGKDANPENIDAFFGSQRVFRQDPVISEVSLPTGRWRIAAIPKGGWATTPENAWTVRLLILIGGLLVILPIIITSKLFDQRRTHVKEVRKRQEQLERLSQRLRLALDASSIGIWELNLDTNVLTWDKRMRELYGISEDTDTSDYVAWSEALHPDDRATAEREFKQAVANRETYNSEFRVIHKDGSVHWLRAIGAVHNTIPGQRYIVGVNWDVSDDVEMKTHLMEVNLEAKLRNTELEQARSLMEHNALHDSLTGLPNRRFLDQNLLDSKAGRMPKALLHIDLDRFKQINDTLGHAAGDAMLCHAAAVLRKNIDQTDFVVRVGGDEFVIAIMTETNEEQLSRLASKIIYHIRQPVPYENHQCRIGASIGIAMPDTSTADYGRHMLINADIALYRAKSNGRNCYQFFSGKLKAEVVRNKRISDDILSGLERQEFLPYFQPQFDAKTLQIIGVEALARWDHPSEGILAPDAFLQTADELNVVPLIDRTILEQTLWQSMRWKAANISIPKMSVNVSAGRLSSKDLMDTLEGLVIEPGTLSFELLESIFLDEKNDTIAENFKRLREMGIDIEIDDFGTGYASIVSLIHLNPSRLKIDRQLITPIVDSENQRRLVSSIIEIGQSLGIKVLAEGVETMEHARILRDLGCDSLQGYAFAAPMSSAKLIDFVREERWLKAA